MPEKSNKRVRQVTKWRTDQALASVLWGAVAAVGQFSMLFLSIIGRIHVGFSNEAPVFSVDPRGPVHLTKDSALASVWAMTLAYALLVMAVVYLRPSPSKRQCFALSLLAAALAAVVALAEPWWGLIVLADLVALYPVLRARTPDKEPTASTEE